MAVGPNQGIKNEINVTPLVDVVLVLLIIFMVVTPMLQRGKGVVLPRAHKAEGSQDRPDPLIVSVTSDKRVYVEQDFVGDGKELEQRLKRELEAKPGIDILLKGDNRLEYSEVRKVMDQARHAGAKGIGLGVEEIKAETAKK